MQAYSEKRVPNPTSEEGLKLSESAYSARLARSCFAQERCGAYEQLSAAAFYFKDRAEIMVAVEVVDRADDRIYRQTVKYHGA